MFTEDEKEFILYLLEKESKGIVSDYEGAIMRSISTKVRTKPALPDKFTR